jgi:hypothetical protein
LFSDGATIVEHFYLYTKAIRYLMENETYRLRELKNRTYIEFEKPSSSFTIKPISLPDKLAPLKDHFNYSKIEMPEKIFTLLKQVTENLQINENYNDLLFLIAASQKFYIDFENGSTNSLPLAKDFENEKIAFSEFLDFIERYLFEKNFKRNIHNIKFNQNKAPFTLKNFFIIKKVYDSFIAQYELNLSIEEFKKRKKELLEEEDINQFRYSRGKHYALHLISSAFYDTLMPAKITSENLKYKYIGVLLNISQIPIGDEVTIFLAESIDNHLQIISPNTIRNYHKREVSTSV